MPGPYIIIVLYALVGVNIGAVGTIDPGRDQWYLCRRHIVLLLQAMNAHSNACISISLALFASNQVMAAKLLLQK